MKNKLRLTLVGGLVAGAALIPVAGGRSAHAASTQNTVTAANAIIDAVSNCRTAYLGPVQKDLTAKNGQQLVTDTQDMMSVCADGARTLAKMQISNSIPDAKVVKQFQTAGFSLDGSLYLWGSDVMHLASGQVKSGPGNGSKQDMSAELDNAATADGQCRQLVTKLAKDLGLNQNRSFHKVR